MAQKIISLQNISYVVQHKFILQNITLDVFNNSILSIIGPNGSGKTTLMRIILRLLKTHSGQIIMQNNDLKFGYVPQSFQFSPFIPLTVKDFLNLILNRKLELNELNNLLEIDDLLPKKVQSLSGGEMKMVLLARALICKPDVLILDEPTSYLDFEAEKSFYQLIENIRELFSCAIVLVSHDLHLVSKNSDYVVCLNQKICCQGRVEEILADPKSYLSLYFHQHNN